MVIKNNKGAMEMSVGTIVTIVLLMSVLVLGIFLIQKVFQSGTGAVDAIDKEVENQINKLFSEEGKPIAIFPSSREITIEKGDNPKGFAFSINNKDVVGHEYTWTVEAQPSYDFQAKCGPAMTAAKANSFLLLAGGTIRLGRSSQLDIPELVKFIVPESSAACTIPYRLEVDDENGPFQGVTIFVTIKS